jgi:hypothetical protein
VSIASTDGLLGLALIACNPELVSSGLTMSRSSSVPAKPFGMDAATRPKMCSRARARCSPMIRAIRNSAGSSTRCSLRNSRARPVRAAVCSRRQASSNSNCSSRVTSTSSKGRSLR